MKTFAIAGVVLIVLGLAGLLYGGFSYTSRETIVDVGPIQATAERTKSLPIPPVAGAVAVAAGVALLVVGMRKRT